MPAASTSPSLKPLPPDSFGSDQARHLLWRAGFGGSPRQLQTLVSWGLEKSVRHLLDYSAIQYGEAAEGGFDKDIIRPPTQDEQRMLAQARRASDEETVARFRARVQERERLDREQVRRLQKWWLKRMIESPRPLEEKMTLFWHGHFATSYRTIENSYHMFLQNQLFRRHAVGDFRELLFAIIRDPAMIAYLDNNDSRKNRPNENLAREIMELFALGEGHYTEKDIKEGARALTGYTFVDDEFVFQQANHDFGSKEILGKSGNLDGDDFVVAILEQRACATWIATKLYRFFVADYPSGDKARDAAAKGAIAELTSSILRARYKLAPALERLFLSEHFYAEAVMNQHIKSPAELVVGAVRSLLVPPRDLTVLLGAMRMMGQDILFPPSVKGWDGGRAWINTSTLFVRHNILCYLLTGKLPAGYDAMADEEKYDPSVLLTELAATAPGADKNVAPAAEALLKFTVGDAASHNVEELTSFAGAALTPETATGMLLLNTAMPEYQLC
jgi:uncharacterized protein (DUF1800 family)